MELTKRDSKMIQGLCVVAMLCLHLFNKSYVGRFQPIFFIKDIPLSFYISMLCDFCVMGYAFCSGYAHMKLFEESGYYQKRIKSLIPLLSNYWFIMIVFSVISVSVGKESFMPGNIKTFIGHALLLENTYNGAWWYMFAYVFIILLSPVILRCVKKNKWKTFGIAFVIYVVSYYIRFHVQSESWLLGKLGPLGMTVFEYILGALCCEMQWFSKIHKIWRNIPNYFQMGITFSLIIGMLLIRTLLVPSLFVAPATGFIIICLFHFWKKTGIIEKIFLYIGKHSTNIWLIHMFFYSKLFENFVYIAKYPILIFLLMLAITLIVSNIIHSLEKTILKKRNITV